MTQRGKAYNIAIIGILGALIILQAYIPMVGYVQIFPAWPAISTIHLTVIIGGIVLDYGGGASLGLLWGLTSLIRAYTSATDPVTLLLFRNPIIAIVPRVMVGLVAAFIFHQLFKKKQTPLAQTVKMVFAGVVGALTNTLLVIGFTWLMFASKAAQIVPGADATNLGWLLMTALAINAVAEALLGGIVTPILGHALLRFRRK
ncbi:ECF transporter S component [Lacticaseibacillus paracasei]|uniref:ECF transporter S component n=1 Tax=Lacticaseibacillus paracasei TaxID=1597 RepID=UPI0025A16966|nr:ECF transporter S component [Lacticaseibacillus paracasei]MDM7532047.1 ECF transporter S component [Lacticaseibacillus paracasei]